ncbi:MAG: hypothetical protein GKR77_06190 [Legionellales bacterium]|nr:hypothetical protein [Legionellales bacterium]
MSHDLIEIATWRDMRDEIANLDTTLANIIDLIKPNDQYHFIKVKYPYGAKILYQGELHLPNAHYQDLPLSHQQISSELKKQLGYRFTPMGFITKNLAEVYFESETRLMPAKVVNQGEFFGLWQLLDPPIEGVVKTVWHISAGARSAFFLPNVSDNTAHLNLKRDFKISYYAPKTLSEQQEIFREIALNSEEGRQWSCDVIFLGHKWASLDLAKNTKAVLLRNYWLEQAWNQSFYCRSQMTYDVTQEAFSLAMGKKNLKPKPYHLNTIDHLIAIGKGMYPGFIPNDESSTAMPTTAIEDAYIHSYKLKNYAPITMRPYQGQSVPSLYYSLSFPTLLSAGAHGYKTSNILAELREIKTLINLTEDFYKDTHLQFDLYHSEKDRFDEIKHSSDIPKEDPNFQSCLDRYQAPFPFAGQFLRGCIKITNLDYAQQQTQ